MAAHQAPLSLGFSREEHKWVAISFSNAWKWKNKVKLLSRVWLLVTPWTAAHQAPPSMGFSRQEYWSGVPLPSPHYILGTFIPIYFPIQAQYLDKGIGYPLPSPAYLPDPGVELGSPALQVDSLPIELSGKPHFEQKDYSSPACDYD